MRKFRSACWLVTICAGFVSAQQITGTIRGTVTDPSGAVVQSANVIAQQIETGFTRSANTDRGGNYIQLRGFRSSRRKEFR